MLFTLLFCLFLPFYAYCEMVIDTLWQTTFSIEESPLILFDIVSSGDGEWIAVGGGVSDSSTGVVLRINENGTVTDTLLLPAFIPSQVFILDNNDLLLDGYEYEGRRHLSPAVGRLVDDGTFLWFHSPPQWGSHRGKLAPIGNGQFAIMDTSRESDTSKIIYFNGEGEITDTLSLPEIDAIELSIIGYTGSLIGLTGYDTSGNDGLAPGWIGVVDLDGNLLWDYNDSLGTSVRNRRYQDIIRLDDGSIIVGSEYVDLYGGGGIKLHLNDHGEMSWLSGGPYLSDFLSVTDAGENNFLTVGTCLQRNMIDYPETACIVLFNDDGETLNTVIMEDSLWIIDRASLNCIIANEDTSRFIAVGKYENSAWILGIEIGEVSVDNNPEITIPTQITLSKPYPNPFNSSTHLIYTLPEQLRINISVIDLLGRQILSIDHGLQTAGTHRINFNSDGLTSGMYLVYVETSYGVISRRIVLLK